jgi:hypothetical protein
MNMIAQRRALNLAAGPTSLAAGVAAGVVAGVVAAAAVAAVQVLIGMRDPGLTETAWSAFVAGIAGGILYGALTRVVRSPGRALWVASLAIAAIDSLLVILLPLPAGHGPHLGIPISGLIVPVRQLAALIGLGRFGARHFPAALLPADTVLHFVPAVVVAELVPRLAGPKPS